MSDLSAEPQITIFNSSVLETLKGEPRSIRISRLDQGSRLASLEPRLQETVTFSRGQRPSERRIYAASGDLYSQQLYLYDPNGHLHQIKSFDSSGVQFRTENVSRMPNGTEITEARDQNNHLVERVTTRRDGEGRILESTSIDVSGVSNTKQIDVTAQYDSQGEPVILKVLLKHSEGGSVLFRTEYRAGRQELTMYDSSTDGGPLTPLTQTSAGASTEIEQITQKDEKGNWTKKEVSGPRGSAEIVREIIYY